MDANTDKFDDLLKLYDLLSKPPATLTTIQANTTIKRFTRNMERIKQGKPEYQLKVVIKAVEKQAKIIARGIADGHIKLAEGGQ